MDLEDFKNTLLHYQTQVEGFLKENENLDPEYRIPLEEFSLNAKKLESLKQALREREEAVVQQVEEARLKRQLQCHYLKEFAWDQFRKPLYTLCATSGNFSVSTYPISSDWLPPTLLQHLWLRLKELDKISEADVPESSVYREEELLWNAFLKVEPPHRILLDQFQLNCAESVRHQIALLEIRFKENFNVAFEAKKARKSWMLREIRSLVQQHRELKHEAKKFVQYESKKLKSDEETHHLQLLSTLKEECKKEEDFEIPEWFSEERPETLLYIEDGDVSGLEEADEEVISKTLVSSSSSSEGDIPEEEGSLPLFKGGERRLSHILSFQMYGDNESPWPWVKAQEERSVAEIEANQSKLRFSNASRLALQIQRTKPTIESLKEDFDAEFFNLSFQKIRTDQKIHVCKLMQSRLLRRVKTEEGIQTKLQAIKKEHYKLELQRAGLVEDISKIYRKEKKAKGVVEGLLKTLKDEDVAVQRAFINLPVDAYKHILALYRTNKNEEPSQQTVFPANEGVDEEKKALQSTSDDEKRTLEIGRRTWRLYGRYRHRKDELIDEVEAAKEAQNQLSTELGAKNMEKSRLTTCIADTEAQITELTEKIQTLNEDLEIVLLLPSKRIKIDLDTMAYDLRPDFDGTQLIPQSELDDLLKKAGKRLDGVGDQEGEAKNHQQQKHFPPDDEKTPGDEGGVVTGGEGAGSSVRSKVEELVKERGRLLLQVELAEERLKQITRMRVGREILVERPPSAHTGSEEKPPEPQGAAAQQQQLYDSIIKLKEYQRKEIDTFRARISKKKEKLQSSQDRIKMLQAEIESLSRNIDDMQRKNPSLGSRESQHANAKRMSKVMSMRKYREMTKKKGQDIIDLQRALKELSMKTFPVLPDRAADGATHHHIGHK